MIGKISRRTALTGLLSTAASAALANAPLTSPAPLLRPEGWPPPPRPRARPGLHDIIEAAELGGRTGVIVRDARTGDILERSFASAELLPASVTKAVTGIYALEVLGPYHRFTTTLWADGEVTDGVLNGTLVLAGGGDPTLLTDDLAGLAEALAATGLRSVTGGFEVWDHALPYIDEIDPAQMDHLGYNPALSGLNLNFNRVHFEWARTGADYTVTLDARSERYRPEVHTARMRVVDRTSPVYTYADTDGIDDWTVARRALGSGGTRWLPVRRPALYAGDVFRTFAASHGLRLPKPVLRADQPTGTILAAHESAELSDILRDCLKYSTNITAEVLGLNASAKLAGHPEDQLASASRMNRWIAERTGAKTQLHDHSGLGDDSLIAPYQMVKMLTAPGVEGRLRPLLKSIPLIDSEGNTFETTVDVRAKTGTLNFISTLAGYIRTANGRDLSFAIFSAELERREAAKASLDDIPEGASAWNARAKWMQQELLKRWGRL